MKSIKKEYQIEFLISSLLIIFPFVLEFMDSSFELKILSYVVGAFGIIPLMFILFSEKYKSFYFENILNYKGANDLVFSFLKIPLSSYQILKDDNAIECSICLQDKFVIELLTGRQIVKWDSVDSMGEEFWKDNKDNQYFDKCLRKYLCAAQINRKFSVNSGKKYDFAIATLINGKKIIFSEVLEADTRMAKMFFGDSKILEYEATFEAIAN